MNDFGISGLQLKNVEDSQGLATQCKAIEGHVRFGCNLGQMIAYICGL